MNYLKSNPIGIDKAIERLQKSLYTKLGYSNIDGYGRVYRLDIDGKFIPAHFISGTDYKEVFFNDKGNSNGNFFFYIDPVSTMGTTNIKVDANIVFQFDVNKITDSNHRNDEEILADIMKVLKGSAFTVDKITRGIRALEDFDTDLLDIKILFIKISGNINYNINC